MAHRTTYEATVKRWGNSLAFRLPKGAVEHLALREGDKVELKITKVAPSGGAERREDPM